MVLNRLAGVVFAGALFLSPLAADVVILVGPPHVLVEKRGHRPSYNHEWISGYHRWDGNAYVWSPGRWEVRPHYRAHYVEHRWVHERGGWVLVGGYWR